MIKIDALKNIYLFQDMTPDEVAKIAKVCVERKVISGQEVFFTGQKAESFFVIQQGTVKIMKTTSSGDDIQIATLATGGHFGEIPFLNGDSRTANAQATETCSLIELPYTELRKLLDSEVKISDKFHRALSRFLASRLKTTTSDLSVAKETLLQHF